jgi:hypothetical protein
MLQLFESLLDSHALAGLLEAVLLQHFVHEVESLVGSHQLVVVADNIVSVRVFVVAKFVYCLGQVNIGGKGGFRQHCSGWEDASDSNSVEACCEEVAGDGAFRNLKQPIPGKAAVSFLRECEVYGFIFFRSKLLSRAVERFHMYTPRKRIECLQSSCFVPLATKRHYDCQHTVFSCGCAPARRVLYGDERASPSWFNPTHGSFMFILCNKFRV